MLPERKGIYIAGDEDLRLVIAGRTIISVDVGAVLRLVVVGGTIGQSLGPRVGQCDKTAPVEAGLHARFRNEL